MPRVTVILSDEEYAHAKKKAGLIPLSAWFRALAQSTPLMAFESKHLNDPSFGRARKVPLLKPRAKK